MESASQIPLEGAKEGQILRKEDALEEKGE
jgi:hypothetical protein